MAQPNHLLNGIGHFDIAGPDIAPLGSFYTGLFGWQVTPRGPGYAMLGTPGLNGALVEQPDASLTIGIVVPDLDQALTLAASLGGAITLPKTDNGWVKKAQIADPAGNLLTLIQG